MEEVEEADLILHVRDIASPASAEQAHDVEKVLATLGVGEAEAADRVIEIWNKLDLLGDEDRALIETKARRSREERKSPAFTISAVTGEGVCAAPGLSGFAGGRRAGRRHRPAGQPWRDLGVALSPRAGDEPRLHRKRGRPTCQ